MSYYPTIPERPLDPPDIPAWCGNVTFVAYVNDETVEVECRIVDDEIEWSQCRVMYQNVDVLPLLTSEQTKYIDQHFFDNFATITRFDCDDDY